MMVKFCTKCGGGRFVLYEDLDEMFALCTCCETIFLIDTEACDWMREIRDEE